MDPVEHPREELHPARRVPVHQQLRADLRLGQLRGRARSRRSDFVGYDALAPASRPRRASRADIWASASRRGSRSAASARARPRRRHGRPGAGRVSPGAHAPDRVGRRCYVGYARARPGPRDDVRPDRGRHAGPAVRARSRSATATRPRARRSATARTAAAAWRWAAWPCARLPSKIVDKATEDRRAPARGVGRRRRLRPGPLPRQGQSGNAQDDGRGRLRRLRRATCPRASSTASKPSRTSIRPTSCGRSAPTSASSKSIPATGQRRSAEVRRRRRLRQRHQPADRRGPAAWRHRPGHRPGAVRGGRLRPRDRPADDRLADRLPGADRQRDPDAESSTAPSRPVPTNELGVKGIGEAGTIASSAAVINAIVDALKPLGITHVDMPASPDRLWKQIQDAQPRNGGARMIPAAFDYQRAPRRSTRRRGCSAQGERRQSPRRRPQPDPADAAAAGPAEHAGRHQRAGRRARLHPPRQRHACASARSRATTRSKNPTTCKRVAAAAGRNRGRSRRRPGADAWAPSAACWRTPIRPATTARWR